MTIWIDADGTPRAVIELVLRAAERRGVAVVMVANRAVSIPRGAANVRSVQVAAGADVADAHIVAHCAPADLVVTSDVPLAAQVVARGAVALQPRGELLTADNAGEHLAMRDFMNEMRGAGLAAGGPPPLAKGDLQRFANALDRWLTAHR